MFSSHQKKKRIVRLLAWDAMLLMQYDSCLLNLRYYQSEMKVLLALFCLNWSDFGITENARVHNGLD